MGSWRLQLEDAFSRLTLTVDSERLAEVDALGDDVWRPHPEGMPGNSSLSLLAVDGDPEDDGVRGPMRPTPHLALCPYASRVLAALKAPIGRTRFMRIVGNGEARAHCDTNYYWQERMRVHVPVRTTPGVRFYCGDDDVHMAPGEVWIFDTWRTHKVVNPTGESADPPGGRTPSARRRLWEMLERPRAGDDRCRRTGPTHGPGDGVGATTPPSWARGSCGRLADEVLTAAAGGGPAPGSRALTAEVHRFHRQWRAGWARFGDDPATGGRRSAGWRDDFDAGWPRSRAGSILRNGLDGASRQLRQLVVQPRRSPPGLRPACRRPTPPRSRAVRRARRPRWATAPAAIGHARRRAGRPADGAPGLHREPAALGHGLLFETLAAVADLVHHRRREPPGHRVGVPALRPAARDWASTGWRRRTRRRAWSRL